MELLLKYVTLLTLVGAAVSFLFGLIKWVDQRNREQEQKEHQAFHRMVCLASGRSEDGQTVAMSQQLAAIYQLQAYPRFGFASVPVLTLFKFEHERTGAFSDDPRASFLVNAIDETIAVLAKAKK